MPEVVDMKHHSPSIKLLQASVEPDSDVDSEFRLLVDDKFVKYITISGGLYDPDDMCFAPTLISLLPPLPAGDWNTATISRDPATGLPYVESVKKEQLPGITKLWHPVQVDHLELQMGRKLRSNVYEATCPRLGPAVVVAKFARFPWEVGYLGAETAAYAWIEGHDIGPAFLGHLSEQRRVIGFIMARVGGGEGPPSSGPASGCCSHATAEDLPLCQSALQKLHALGIRHCDTNKHNFLVQYGRATLIDFDSASRPASAEELDAEFQGLPGQLCDTSGRGGILRTG